MKMQHMLRVEDGVVLLRCSANHAEDYGLDECGDDCCPGCGMHLNSNVIQTQGALVLFVRDLEQALNRAREFAAVSADIESSLRRKIAARDKEDLFEISPLCSSR